MTSEMLEPSDAEQGYSTRRTREIEELERRGEGQDAGNRLKKKLNLQRSSKRAAAEAEAGVEELIVFSQGSITAKRCSCCGSALTPAHLLPLRQSKIRGERTHGRRQQVIVHPCGLGRNTFHIGKMDTKGCSSQKKTTGGSVLKL